MEKRKITIIGNFLFDGHDFVCEHSSLKVDGMFDFNLVEELLFKNTDNDFELNDEISAMFTAKEINTTFKSLKLECFIDEFEDSKFYSVEDVSEDI